MLTDSCKRCNVWVSWLACVWALRRPLSRPPAGPFVQAVVRGRQVPHVLPAGTPNRPVSGHHKPNLPPNSSCFYRAGLAQSTQVWRPSWIRTSIHALFETDDIEASGRWHRLLRTVGLAVACYSFKSQFELVLICHRFRSCGPVLPQPSR